MADLFRAARWMGVAPWDLLQRPAFWQQWAMEVEAADQRVEIEFAKRYR